MKYILQPYTAPDSRHHCPQCNDRRKTFKRYIDTQTGLPVADNVGRCDREQKCGYHYTPWQYYQAEGGRPMVHGRRFAAKMKQRPMRPMKRGHQPSAMDHGPNDYLSIPVELVSRTTRKYKQNNFVQYLIKRFGAEMTRTLATRYYIGTAKHWPGATIFWQVDGQQVIRTGKVMLYDKLTGKRVKHPFSHITWAHSLLSSSGTSSSSNLDDAPTAGATATATLKQCLFGEHLLNQFPDAPVALVESEKTAIIASALNGSFIWLAVGSIGNLNPQLCRVLKGRKVTLYPDLGAYDQWKAKARLLQTKIPRTIFNVSDVLERGASRADREHGLDIGDFL